MLYFGGHYFFIVLIIGGGRMGHWYKQDGTPCYFQPDGKDTTLRHARQQNLVPSVSEIINIIASPGLEIYKQNQLLDAVLNNPPGEFLLLDKDDVDSWKREIVTSSKAHAQQAAEDGKRIHDVLEQYFKEGNIQSNYSELYENVLTVFENNELPCTGWIAEQSFASPLGYGGCVDLHHPEEKIVLDFKTKNNDNFSKSKQYDNHNMQTAAYTVGLFAEFDYYDGYVPFHTNDEIIDSVRRYNLFINIDDYKEMKLFESKNFKKDWTMYQDLLEYWKFSKNYDGGFK